MDKNEPSKSESASTSTLGAPRVATPWLLPFALLVVAVVAVPLGILDERGLPRYRALRSELTELGASNEQLQDQVRALKADVDELRHNPEAIERLARDELGMVRDGELVFQFSK